MRFKIILLFLLYFNFSQAQTEITGKIVDENNEPVIGANIYLAGTYDGTSSDIDGNFTFSTEENGTQLLTATSVGFKRLEKEIQISQSNLNFELQLEADINIIEEVVITAGSFEASDSRKAVVLRPLDIVSTAGATADIAGVMNNLPGTQTVAEDGRLYVRGGDSKEVKAFVDGMLVSEPFDNTPPNIPSRFRFSPFLFNGTFFSTGGYSAEYGNALSSVLVLNTNDLPARSQTDISIMSVGVDVNQTIRFDNSSVYAQFQYTDLTLNYKIVPQKYEWNSAPRGINGIIHYKNKFKKGLLKFYSNYQHSDLDVIQPYFMDVTTNERIDINNNYYYNNLSVDYQLHEKISLKGGVSGSYFNNRSNVGQYGKTDEELAFHMKILADVAFTERLFLKTGIENFISDYQLKLADFQTENESRNGFSNNLIACFTEMDIYLPFKVVLRPGLRIENSSFTQKTNISPRFSMAYKIADNSQLSAAVGRFYQLPDREYLVYEPNLNCELADHYILNYQVDKNDILFRTEIFIKNYKGLITYSENSNVNITNLKNSGEGTAKGVDLFWRDRNTIKNGDYWLSYSFVDSEREYKNYNGSYTPPYISKHNFSAVYKQFFEGIKSQVGLTYHYSGRRNYDDPNTELFLDQKVKPYHDLSANWSFIYKPNIIFHFSVSNLLGFNNEFGRQYSAVPNEQGYYESIPIQSQAKRFIFLGCFITFSKDKNANQLNNL